MRKQVLFGAALLALGTAVVSSCSKDEVVIDNTPGVETPVAEGEQEIILQVANTGDGLTTRAGRPLFSSEAKQSIEKVRVVIVQTTNKNGKQGQVVAVKEFTDWMGSSSVYGPSSSEGHGRQATWKLVGNERVAKGESFRVYAVGYTKSNSLYTKGITAFESLNTTTASPFGSWFNSTINTENGLGEEIFAGEIASISTDENTGDFILTTGNTNNVLTLHRQVAGAMGYFTSIPVYKVGDTYSPIDDLTGYTLRLISSNLSNQIVLTNFNSDFVNTGDGVEFIVNGNQKNLPPATIHFYESVDNQLSYDGYEVFSIDLSKWFPNGDVNGDGLLDEGDIVNTGDWDTPASVEGASFKPGSVFAGTFLIPFAKVVGHQTLQLQLVNDQSEVIRVWNINLPSDDKQVAPEAGHALIWNGIASVAKAGFEKSAEMGAGENVNHYSMVRNHLYTIGEKSSDIYDPENPGTDIPEDLSKGQNLVLKVNDNWELIHKMEVE